MHCRWAMLGTAGVLAQVRTQLQRWTVQRGAQVLLIAGVSGQCADEKSMFIVAVHSVATCTCNATSTLNLAFSAPCPDHIWRLSWGNFFLQEIFRPDVFWYEAATKTESPFGIVGLLAFEFWAMHFVEIKRWQVRTGDLEYQLDCCIGQASQEQICIHAWTRLTTTAPLHYYPTGLPQAQLRQR